MKKELLLTVVMVLIGFLIAQSIDFTATDNQQAVREGGSTRLAELLGSRDSAGYASAIDPRAFVFPADHGPHPEYRNEWWYVTGNLDSENGRRFGFELTFFRFALTPGGVNSDSAWRSNQVYIAHFAVTDAEAEKIHVAQRFSRAALGLAGAGIAPFRVWIDDWSISGIDTDDWQLTAADEDVSLRLTLRAEKDPVLNGIDGLSQKSSAAGNASYYYSISRLQSRGTLRVGGSTFAVTGLSWFDREWSSSALEEDQQGWDWFALQLNDGSDLMFYNIRDTDGGQDVHSAGTWVDADGFAHYLGRDDVELRVTDTWSSPQGGTYPSRWNLRVPSLDLAVDVVPVIDDQELFTTVRYWEGAVDVDGQRGQRPVTGRGYVELTGYAD